MQVTPSQSQLLPARLRFADWVAFFLEKAGIPVGQRGHGRDQLTFGRQGATVVGRFVESPPYLEFSTQGEIPDATLVEAARLATERLKAQDGGSSHWCRFQCAEQSFDLFSAHSGIEGLVLRLGTQQRIIGWRRLGGAIMLEFKEEGASEGAQLFAPRALVDVHVSIQAPLIGFLCEFVLGQLVDVLTAICGFALGRPVNAPPALFPVTDVDAALTAAQRDDRTIGTLARKGIALDVVSINSIVGGPAIAARIQGSLLAFDAAMRQQRAAVANLLYVVAAESLTVPAPVWRSQRVSARFVDFYLREIAPDLDAIIAHDSFEESFGIRKGDKAQESLRKRLLVRLYGVRSARVHEGLPADYRGLGVLQPAIPMERALVHDFAEAAILSYLRAPRSSLIGHPRLYPPPNTGTG